MEVVEREEGDRALLDQLIRREKNAKQRDRLRAVAMALDGHDKLAVADTLHRSKSFVEDWVYAYRDRGIGALKPNKPTGRPRKLTREQEAAFLERVDAGPTDADRVCTLRGSDLRRILEHEFGATYSQRGVYALMRRLGYSSLKPRPIHEHHDPAKAHQFKDDAPLLFVTKPRGVPANACV